MKARVGQYVKALYDFQTSERGEITLKKGDILLVSGCVDDNWLCGKLGAREGNFPSSFVEILNVPSVQNGQKLFRATENFPAQVEGDLEFRKGDVVLGTQRIDSNWWKGKVDNKEGIFPLTHVDSLETLDDLPLDNTPVFTRQTSGPTSSEFVTRVEATALVGSTAQLDDELGFQKGDKIWITELIDSDWYRGECNGKSGMFLSDCVTVLGDLSKLGVSRTPEKRTRSLSRTTGMSLEENNFVPSNKKSSPKSKSNSLDNRNRSASYNSENTRSQDNEVTPYAKTLYSFTSQAPNELSFKDNEIVKLIKHVDADWIEGELDGKAGLFPASFVEIIVDCPYAFDDDQNSTLPAGNERPSIEEETPSLTVAEPEKLTEGDERYGLVLYDFTAESSRDLSLSEGDTIIILKQIDDNWLEAKDESGNVGMCPVQFVEIIGVEPTSLKKSAESTPTDFTENAKNEQKDFLPRTNGLTMQASETQEQNNIDQVKRSSTSDTDSNTSNDNSNQLEPKTQLTPPKMKPQIKPKPTLAPKPVVIGGKFPRSRPTSTELVNSPQTQALDMIIKEELLNSSGEGSRSRSSSIQSSASSVGSGGASGPAVDAQTPPNGPSLPVRPKPPKPAPPLKAISRDSAFHNKAYMNDSGNYAWGLGEGRKSVGQSTFFIDSFSEEGIAPNSGGKSSVNRKVLPVRKPPPPPLRTPSTDEPEMYRKPSLRKPPPPRPSGPRVASAPPKTVLTPLVVNPTQLPKQGTSPQPVSPSELDPLSKKPSRPAPPRPAPRTTPPRRAPPKPVPRSPSDLMTFTPNANKSHDIEGSESEDVLEVKRMISDVEKDLEKCIKSRGELEMMLSQVDDVDDKDEIEENLEFYQANITGLSQELTKLKANLHELTGETDKRTTDILSIEQQRVAAEIKRRELEEERKKLEERDSKLREEMKQERIKKRQNVIDELLQTEKDYLLYLQLCVGEFLSQSNEKDPAMDREVLFGNMEEIADVAQKLLTAMEGCINGKDFSEQVVGSCFVKLSEDMKNAYAPYCRNHDDVHVLLEKYEDNTAIQEYVEGILDKIRQRVNVFDFGSLLIKPVQRILKYPLLLNELLKTTEDDHPDKTELMAAIIAMTDVATAINEYKRRKDLVFKYKKETDVKFGDKIAKLNLHSLKKKSTRLRARLSTNLGISLQTKDETFHKHEARFRAMDKILRTCVRDVQMYLEQAQEGVMLQESVAADISDYYEERPPEIVKYESAVLTLATELFVLFKSTVDDLVIDPLNSLVSMFDGPSNVIQKRFDKLLDYDSLYKKIKDVDKSRVAKEALQAAKNDYEAMNAQLLDELPKLHDLAFSLLKDCMGAFVKAQKHFSDSILNDIYPLLELPMLLSTSESVMETFNIKYVPALDKMSSFSFIPKGFNPRVEPAKLEKRSKRHSLDTSMFKTPTNSPSSVPPSHGAVPSGNAASPQSPSQKIFVQQSYPPDKTYKVIHSYTALNVMDLSVCEGDVVGIIKASDPMGDKARWFIDNGESKGFVPRKFLALYAATPPRTLDFSTDLMGNEEAGESPLPDGDDLLGDTKLQVDWSAATSSYLTPEDPPPPYPDEFYFAEYTFTARNQNEVSLFEGQVISVISKKDLDGNAEWWWVDADGHLGFVPAAYLKKMEGDANG